MIGYKVNNTALANTLSNNLTVAKSLAVAYETGFYYAGKEAVRLIKNRVQNNGVSADGQVLYTKSRAPLGAYGQRHGSARRERGLQVSRVDLTFTGRMFADFGISLLRKDFVQVGFTRQSEAQKMEEMEEYYGTEILTVSDDEEAQAVAKLEERVFDTLNKLFA